MLKRIGAIVTVFVAAAVAGYWLLTFPGPGRLTGVTWHWSESRTVVGGNAVTTVVPDPDRYTIVFNPDGTAVLTADCNQAPWTYTTAGRSMELQSHAVVWSACGPGSRAQALVDVLWHTDTYSVGVGRLVLEAHYGFCLFGCEPDSLTFTD